VRRARIRLALNREYFQLPLSGSQFLEAISSVVVSKL